MEPFTITTHLSRSEFSSLIFWKYIKRPVTIIFSIMGMITFLLAALDFAGIIDIYPDQPWLELFIGLTVMLLPFLASLRARKQYDSLKRLHSDINYTFSEDRILVKGDEFESSYSWNTLRKFEERPGYVLLYHSKISAEIIHRKSLTEDQVIYIKSKIKR
jgi:hypothetical protein